METIKKELFRVDKDTFITGLIDCYGYSLEDFKGYTIKDILDGLEDDQIFNLHAYLIG